MKSCENLSFTFSVVEILICKHLFLSKDLKTWVKYILEMIYDQFSKTA